MAACGNAGLRCQGVPLPASLPACAGPYMDHPSTVAQTAANEVHDTDLLGPTSWVPHSVGEECGNNIAVSGVPVVRWR